MSILTVEQKKYFSAYPKNDAGFASEQKKYMHAIPSRNFILELLKAVDKMSFNGIVEAFQLKKEWQLEALNNRLFIMCRDGQIYSNQFEEFALMSDETTIVGRFEGTVEGHGYVTVEGQQSVYISPKDCKNVLHHDEVEIKITGLFRSKSMRQGTINRVVKHNLDEVIARVSIYDGVALAIPENKKISQHFMLVDNNLKDAKNHDLVKVKLELKSISESVFLAEIVEVLGQKMTKDIAILQAIMEHQLPHEFSKATDDLLKTIPDEVNPEDIIGRKDYRNIPLITIDGITAKDFDDAVYAEQLKDGNFKLYVAIADVEHYVKLGSAIDSDALKRGTSVYFPDRVIPMLPEKLSNGLCSLNPDIDRLCVVCELVINSKGETIQYGFFEGVMRSHARLTYELVAELIAEDSPIQEDYKELMPQIIALNNLFKVLKKARERRGSIDFETKETEILHDEQGFISEIVYRERNDAHMIIEECMIAANIAAATFLEGKKVPTLYRVHGNPPEDRLAKLRRFLAGYNLGLEGGDRPEPEHFAHTLAQTEGLEARDIIQLMMLRSMSQAVYHPDNEGHFGLSLTHYAHFTSPIRRYPDLIVHRGIKYLIHQAKNESVKYPYTQKMMVSLGESLSELERRADQAVDDVVSFLKCEYMQQYIGKVLSGTVSGITKFGIFVELDDIHIEGLVHMSNIPSDYYHFDEIRYRLIGEKTGTMIKLKDPVVVKVLDANPETRFIDFDLISLPKNTKLSRNEREKVIAEIETEKSFNHSNQQRKKKPSRRNKKSEASPKKKLKAVKMAAKKRNKKRKIKNKPKKKSE